MAMEQLIRDLNSPKNQGRAEVINSLQRQIQRLQKEPTAWQTGLDLLGNPDTLLQFYGALTLGLKINADWDTDQVGQDRDQVAHLLKHLITSYILCSANGSDVVVSKLSTTLASIFARPDAAWAHPCRHVLSCIIAKRFLPEKEALDIPKILNTQEVISFSAWKALLRLTSAIQYEIGSGNKSLINHRGELQLSNNALDAWYILLHTMSQVETHTDLQLPPSSAGFTLRIEASESEYELLLNEALQQVPAWSKFVAAQNGESHSLDRLFQPAFQILLFCFRKTEYAAYCMPCLAALQAESARLIKRTISDYPQQVQNSNVVRQLMEQMLHGEFTAESNSYVEYLEAVVNGFDCTTDDYLKSQDAIVILEAIRTLTRCQGAAMVEDEACQIILEMLSTIAEGYSDWSEPSQFDTSMNALIKDACLATLAKVQYPEDELDRSTATWDEDDHTKFGDYRFQAKDFFETAFGILGPPLAQDIAQAVSQISGASWSEFEAALFVLISVSDALSNDPEHCDPALNQVFGSPMWLNILQSASHIKGRVRRAVIRLLAETTSYLQRNPQHMIDSLNFLFQSLQLPTHANEAARAIHNLCDGQRAFLSQALPQFLGTITSLEAISLQSRCKVLSGVAALVQALPTESDQIQPLKQIIVLIQNLEEKRAKSSNDDENVNDPLVERVSMLAAVAKGLQSPTDTPINLEETTKDNANFWIDGPGQQIQQVVLQMLSEPWNRILNPDSGDLVTAACDLLRAGFKEPAPSPLKFSLQTSVELVCSLIDLKNANLDQTMNTASCLISSAPLPRSSFAETDTLMSRVLTVTTEACNALTIDPDPSFTAPTSILDFVIRSFHNYGVRLLVQTPESRFMNIFLDYAILLFRSTTDTLPRRSAAAFFTSFIDFTGPSYGYMSGLQTASVLITLLDQYSPTILGLTLHFLAGECARSEVESMSILLRAFISKQPMRAKRIMNEALNNADAGVLTQKAFQATKPEQRARFLAQVEALRGAKKTNEIVRDFWISCKGGQFGYVT